MVLVLLSEWGSGVGGGWDGRLLHVVRCCRWCCEEGGSYYAKLM